MGTRSRERPRRLAVKLKQIRDALGLTLEGMRQALDHGSGPQDAPQIARFERGEREPSLPTLLKYSRIAARELGAAGEAEYLLALVDDERDLPEKSSAKRRRKV